MIPDLQDEPSDDELDLLEELLSGRVDRFASDFKGDAGISTVSGLDGLLTAVVSGPTMIPPSVWMKGVWGDYPPVWETEQEAMTCYGTIFRLMNARAATLMNSPKDYEPLFAEFENEPDVDFVDFWCSGYIRGVELWDQSFESDKELNRLLLPIMVNSGYCPEELSERITEEQRAVMQNSLAACAQLIHNYWLERRNDLTPVSPVRKGGAPGVNDPCPCGSGLKYKKCCSGN